MITFKDLPDTSTPLNAANLNANFNELTGIIENLTPVELYNNTSGSTTNITLSETSANYTYLEVIFGSDNVYQSTGMIYNPNGKTISLPQQSMGTVDGQIYLFTSNWTISGSGINFVKAANKYITPSNTVAQYNTNSYVRIYRVIGYK